MSGEPGRGEIQPALTESRVAQAIHEYLKIAPKSPLAEIFEKIGIRAHKEALIGRTAKAFTEEEIRKFREKLVDSGILPEKVTETRISDEDIERLKTMTQQDRDAAINNGIANLARRANGLPPLPGGVEFKNYEVDNRTGESRPAPPSNPQNSSNR